MIRHGTVVLAGALGGCLLLRDVDALEDRAGAPAVDAGVSEASTPPNTGCPAGMVRVDTYCIDRTEVTVARYARFVGSRGSDTTGQRTDCVGNETFVPANWETGRAPDDFPVSNVDFCDALAFCAWDGKRLCGAIDGGALAMSAMNDPARSQWFRACSRAGTRTFPYGVDLDGQRCSGAVRDAGFQPSGSFADCEGGYDGILDLAGSVREWEDACDAEGCLQRGGAFYDISSTLRCDNRQSVDPKQANIGVGLRCCSR